MRVRKYFTAGNDFVEVTEGIEELGKITKAEFGMSDYNQFGLKLILEFGGAGTHFSIQYNNSEWVERCQWTKEEQCGWSQETMEIVQRILFMAKCDDVSQLVGKPIAIQREGNKVLGFRILTEVL